MAIANKKPLKRLNSFSKKIIVYIFDFKTNEPASILKLFKFNKCHIVTKPFLVHKVNTSISISFYTNRSKINNICFR